MQSVQLYTAEASKQCDAEIIASGIDGFELMQRAAACVFQQVKQLQQEEIQPITVLAGTGNNGGDGLIVASLAKKEGFDVSVVMIKRGNMLSEDANKAFQMAVAAKVAIDCYHPDMDFDGRIIIDALYGTGLNRPVSEEAQLLISAVNNTQNHVLAVDVPSGLCADTGCVLGCAIKADKTISFITRKRGLYTTKGPDYCGYRIFNDLVSEFIDHDKNRALLDKSLQSLPDPVEKLDIHVLKARIPVRPKDSHKGNFGHSVLIGGNDTMAGAIMMAAESCLRTGAGLVTVITKEQHVGALNSRVPEAMTAVTPQQIDWAIEHASAIAIGPGLGEDDWAKALWQKAWDSDLPLVVDAQALSFLAEQDNQQRLAPWIMTPHPGEAGRLLRQSSQEIQADRFSACTRLVDRYEAVVLLKGVGSIVGSKDGLALCASGNPGMASAGMGDVLTGVMCSLITQGYDASFTAQLATQLHASAGDLAADANGQIGLLATDLIPYIRQILNA